MRRLPVMAVVLLMTGGCGAAGEPVALPTPTPQHFTAAAPTAVPASTPAPAPTAAPARRRAPRFLTAGLERRVALRARPGGRVVAHVRRRTEFGSASVLGVLRRRGGWLQVAAAQLPNHRRGWIRARDAVLGTTDLAIRVDRSERRAVLRDGRRAVVAFPVAVGRPGNETPLGRYAVTDKLQPTDSTSPYGCCAIALTGHQTRLEPGWPGGDRLAIHGTAATWTIGQAASLGCMRAPTRALRVLMRRVPLGMPVFVRA